jgi:peptidoglycan/xylan/chitin deacetylase (PgdA/CDA1 family)
VSKREWLAQTLDRIGAFSTVMQLRRVTRTPWLTVISYHRIGAQQGDGVNRDFDPGVIDASEAEFDRQMAFFARHFTVIGIDDLCVALAGGRQPPNAALITFDDGYLTCHQTALPILEKHGLKAVFFIATRFVSERRMFWWDRVGRAVRRAAGRTLRLDYPEPLELPLHDEPEMSTGLHRLLRIIKRRPGLDIEKYLTSIEAAAGAPLSLEEERATVDGIIMTWDHIRALAEAGMDIGSHTRTHRVLQTLSTPELDDELRGSRMELERQVGKPVRSLAYPVGYTVLDRPELVAAVERAGYQVAFSNATGLNISLRPHRLDVRRVATDYGISDAMFRAEVTLPRWGTQ